MNKPTFIKVDSTIAASVRVGTTPKRCQKGRV